MNKELKQQLCDIIDGRVTDTGRVRGILQDADRTCDRLWTHWQRLTDLKVQAVNVFIHGAPAEEAA